MNDPFRISGGTRSENDLERVRLSQALDWPKVIAEEFAAGAKMVVIEGREVGPVGKDIRSDLVDLIVGSTDPRRPR